MYTHDDEVADDDRHMRDPDDHNSTNGPAGLITRIPSMVPTVVPTGIPSVSPSISYAPSAAGPCSHHNPFTFGITTKNDVNLTTSIIAFNYDLETENDIAEFMGHSLVEQTKAVEMALLDLLSKLYFPQCQEYYSGADNLDNTDADADEMKSTLRQRRQQNQDMNNHHNIFLPPIITKSTANNIPSVNTTKLVGMSSKPFDVANGGKMYKDSYSY